MARKKAVAIGIFDGVHTGHQKVIKELLRQAKRNKAESLVITFHPHPKKILYPHLDIPFITTLTHRITLIKRLGVNRIVIINLRKSILRMEPEDFVKRILIGKLKTKILVVGEDFCFGYRQKGDACLLGGLSKKYNFKLFVVKSAKIGNRPISSTRIRQAIRKGRLTQATMMLGRPVTVLGTVVKGRSIGHKLGFPTANVDPHHEAIPPGGVYAVDVCLNKKRYKGILNIGIRPTFRRDREPTIELHIFNFRKNIYGKDVEILFKKKIRYERRFKTVDDLRRQIEKDIQRAKSLPHI